jgi:hypothetical protein
VFDGDGPSAELVNGGEVSEVLLNPLGRAKRLLPGGRAERRDPRFFVAREPPAARAPTSPPQCLRESRSVHVVILLSAKQNVQSVIRSMVDKITTWQVEDAETHREARDTLPASRTWLRAAQRCVLARAGLGSSRNSRLR